MLIKCLCKCVSACAWTECLHMGSLKIFINIENLLSKNKSFICTIPTVVERRDFLTALQILNMIMFLSNSYGHMKWYYHDFNLCFFEHEEVKRLPVCWVDTCVYAFMNSSVCFSLEVLTSSELIWRYCHFVKGINILFATVVIVLIQSSIFYCIMVMCSWRNVPLIKF